MAYCFLIARVMFYENKRMLYVCPIYDFLVELFFGNLISNKKDYRYYCFKEKAIEKDMHLVFVNNQFVFGWM
jgi:hypothetical protein